MQKIQMMMYCIVAISLSLMSITLSYSHATASPSSTCLAQIAQQKSQTETLDLERKVMSFIGNNAAEFKSLNQKYNANWLATNYQWNIDQSTCIATLTGVTEDFELSNSTAPFVGMAHITVDPSASKVIDIKMDMPTVLVPPTCTDHACRIAHGIFN